HEPRQMPPDRGVYATVCGRYHVTVVNAMTQGGAEPGTGGSSPWGPDMRVPPASTAGGTRSVRFSAACLLLQTPLENPGGLKAGLVGRLLRPSSETLGTGKLIPASLVMRPLEALETLRPS